MSAAVADKESLLMFSSRGLGDTVDKMDLVRGALSGEKSHA